MSAPATMPIEFFILSTLMDPEFLGNTTTNTPRKVKFAPKVPRKVKNPVVPKTEKIETVDADDAQAKELLRRFNEASLKVKPKVEKKVAPTQVAFGFGGALAAIKSHGSLKGGNGINSSQGPASEGLRVDKEYREPWDYYSSYPVTLPLRRPYSGNPELLNEEEFGEAAESITYDQHPTKPAIELGLMEQNLEASMFFLQLPEKLPMVSYLLRQRARRWPAAAQTHKSVQIPQKRPVGWKSYQQAIWAKC